MGTTADRVTPGRACRHLRWIVLLVLGAFLSACALFFPNLPIADGISLRYPISWIPVRGLYANAIELVSVGAGGTASAPDARMLVTTERQLSHADAVTRITEIASSRTASVTYTPIDSWPAALIRYREALPRMAERPTVPGEVNEEDTRLALHTTTVIAIDSTVVRLDTTLAPGASDAIAREAEFISLTVRSSKSGDAGETSNELRHIEQAVGNRHSSANESSSAAKRTSKLAAPRPFDPGALATVVATASETSVTVSRTGTNVIVGSNRGNSTGAGNADVSTNSGASFAPIGLTPTFPTKGDPSLAVGASGNFYLSLIGLPGATSTTNMTGLTGCATSVFSSTDGGATFSLAGNAALCAPTGAAMCFPDQGQVSADVTTSTASGDQVYAAWRNFVPFHILGIGLPADCNGISGTQTPTISCSTNSGTSWTTPRVIGGGDRPRLGIGSDGFVYAAIRDGNDVMIHKFTSCSNGLSEVRGFPRRVLSGIGGTTCPLPGLDRCNDGLIVPTVAVDETNAAHVYVAVVKSASGSANNDDVLVTDSLDGGSTWRESVTVNSIVPGRRFMPWLCSASGTAYVGWYDRRAATAAANDLTDYFLGAATMRNGQLQPDGEIKLSGVSDPQCASGWTSASVRNEADAEQCSTQPQLAGICSNAAGGGSMSPCDFSTPSCPSGETCRTGGGAPKYGDYNGIACSPTQVVATWASATSASGSTGGISVFAETKVLDGTLFVAERTIPANDPGLFNLNVDGGAIATAVSNATIGPVTLAPGSPHRVGVSGSGSTSMSDYATSFGGDCDGNGMVRFSALHPATCRVSNLNRAFDACTIHCNTAEGICMRGAHTSADRQECIREKVECVDNCSRATLTVTNHIEPNVDPGRFNLLIDGQVKKSAAGNGESTPDIALVPGMHRVGESTALGTNLGNYAISLSGDCDAMGQVLLQPGQQKSCDITNVRKPGTGADATLTVIKALVPATDPGRFDLSIDGVTRATNVGNGGSTGPIVVMEGSHSVAEVGHGTNLSKYSRTFGGHCNAFGQVTLAPGEQKTCSITNKWDTSRCVADCNAAEGVCMALAHNSADRQECIREKTACVDACQAH